MFSQNNKNKKGFKSFYFIKKIYINKYYAMYSEWFKSISQVIQRKCTSSIFFLLCLLIFKKTLKESMIKCFIHRYSYATIKNWNISMNLWKYLFFFLNFFVLSLKHQDLSKDSKVFTYLKNFNKYLECIQNCLQLILQFFNKNDFCLPPWYFRKRQELRIKFAMAQLKQKKR